MIYSCYYQNYTGPPLTKAVLNEENITDKIEKLYGEKCNWNGYLWTFKEMFGDESYGKNFRFEFKSEDGKDHYFHGYIHDINNYLNHPIHTPVNQDPSYWKNLGK